MYMTYGEAVNTDEMSEKRYLPEGLVEGCRLVVTWPAMRSSRTTTSTCPPIGSPTGSAPSSIATSVRRRGSKNGYLS